MDDDAPQVEEEGGGSPAWMATFADLMSLLMCFFVLLLAFSEMDVLKFKQLAGSMREAFGVQRDIKAMEMPKGTSIIAQEFSPGRPSPTPIVELRQHTTDEAKSNLDFGDLVPRANQKEVDKIEDIKKALKDQIKKMLNKQLEKLKSLLGEDIAAGTIQLESEEEEIVIRIREKGSFPSGTAQLQRSFYPILSKIGGVLKEVDGNIIVSGHTDNLPIFTARFPSNWVLSAARAASVVHHLTTYSKINGERIEIRAYGESRPIDTNKTSGGRAKNRRVEISVRFGSLESISAEDLEATLAAEKAGMGKLDSITTFKSAIGDEAAIQTLNLKRVTEESISDIETPAEEAIEDSEESTSDIELPEEAIEDSDGLNDTSDVPSAEVVDEAVDGNAQLIENNPDAVVDAENIDDSIDDAENIGNSIDDAENLEDSIDDAENIEDSIDDVENIDNSIVDAEDIDNSIDDAENMDNSIDDASSVGDSSAE